MSAITTHVLDTSQGRPAAGISVILEMQEAEGAWTVLSHGTTDSDGRVKDLLPPEREPAAGAYRLRFGTSTYMQGFYPEVIVVFTVKDSSQHYHVPLLLSPYGYTTYRGS